MMRRRSFLLAIAVVAAATATARAAQGPALDQVRIGYQRVHAGDSPGALRYFEELSKQKPDELQFRLGSLTARLDLIEHDDSLMPAYERDLDALIRLADQRYERSQRDSEALHMLATAYMLRAQYRFEHDKGMWGAARDAAKAKGLSDTYVKQHPEHGDAYLVLGMYNYYVGIAPSIFKVMRFLLFLPPGNRVEGLRQIERAAAEGDLVAPLAQQSLIEIYSEFEGRGAEAVALAERLQQRYPENDSFAMSAGAIYAGPFLDDHNRAADVFAAIARRRQNDSSLHGSAARYGALVSLAIERAEQWRHDEAIATLTPVIEANVKKPSWVAPLFLLRRGNLRALVNDPNAIDDIRRVQREFKGSDWAKSADGLQKWMEGRRASGEVLEFAALIPANRLAAERKWTEARQAYETFLARQPGSAWARYRLAIVFFMTEPAEQSMSRFAALAADTRVTASVRGLALLHVGRVHDLAGRREEALKVYKQVVDAYDEERAGRLARIGLLTPYKRPVG